ncbi:hypothetical protein GCM10009551_097400 [Nocardiopsis tropica]
MKVVYCQNWYWFKNRPTEPMTEEQAQRRFNTDGEMKFTIALISNESVDGVPFGTIETMPHGKGITVTRYSASGTPILGIAYGKTGDRMFAFGANENHYSISQDPGNRLLTEMDADVIESYRFSTDGTADVRRQMSEAVYEFISLKVAQTPERSEANWKPLLGFGDWDVYVPPTLEEFHEGLTIEEDAVLNRSDAYPG